MSYEQRQREIEIQLMEQRAAYELQLSEQQAAYEQRQREIEIQLMEQRAANKLQGLQDRQKAVLKFWETLAIVGPLAGALILTTLVALVIYCRFTGALTRQKRQVSRATRCSSTYLASSAAERAPAGTSERADSLHTALGAKVSAFHASYAGFLAFCDDFVLSNRQGTLYSDYTQPDIGRKYYSSGISSEIAQLYMSILSRARGIIAQTDNRSNWTLHEQITELDDIRCRIPAEAFDTVASAYTVLELAGYPHVECKIERGEKATC